MGELLEARALSRYDMTYSTYRCLQRDHIRFEEKYAKTFGNGFICRILRYYMFYVQRSSREKEAFERNVAEYLDKKEHDEYFTEDRITFTKQLKEKFSEFDFITREKFKKRRVITYILERFTQLPLSEREIIYCWHDYCTITEAIDKCELLAVTSSGTEYEVKPYAIKTDENTSSCYLIGYSRPKGSDKKFACYPFKLSRIENCHSCHKESVLSPKEIKELKERDARFGSAYIFGSLSKDETEDNKDNNITVRLTKKGYDDYLRIIAYHRPIPVKEPVQVTIDDNKFYDLTFDCSDMQIENYFFSFGAEAEIISPQSLREKFIKKYEASVKRYGSDEQQPKG